MSSSRRNLPNDCPCCASKQLIEVEEAVELRVGRRRIQLPSIRHEKCLACGERLFGIEANELIDKLALKKRKRVAA